MENKLQEINKEKITQEQREYERHESLVSMCDADEHRRYPSGMLIEDDCHVCGNVHPYIGECRVRSHCNKRIPMDH